MLLLKISLVGIVYISKPEVLTILIIIAMWVVRDSIEESFNQTERTAVTAVCAAILCSTLWFTNGYFPFGTWWILSTIALTYCYRSKPSVSKLTVTAAKKVQDVIPFDIKDTIKEVVQGMKEKEEENTLYKLTVTSDNFNCDTLLNNNDNTPSQTWPERRF